MSVLSNTEIVKALDDRRLVIEPRPHPGPGAENSPYDTISVDLQLASDIYVPRGDIGIAFDTIEQKKLQETMKKAYRPETIHDNGFSLKPNRFILGRTLEEVWLPLLPEHLFRHRFLSGSKDRLSARIEGRSSYARLGLIVHFTAPTIHAGFRGVITLEIINLGQYPIILYPKMRICQLILETVEGVPVAAQSQFHGQRRALG